MVSCAVTGCSQCFSLGAEFVLNSFLIPLKKKKKKNHLEINDVCRTEFEVVKLLLALHFKDFFEIAVLYLILSFSVNFI